MSTTHATAHVVRIVLGDQLNRSHSWFRTVDPNIVYVLAEVRSETDYVVHHIQKVACLFTAMRAFAQHLSDKGHRVLYQRITDTGAVHTFGEIIERTIEELRPSLIQVMEPDEWRVDAHLRDVASRITVPLEVVSSEHFMTERDELHRMFPGKTSWRMESFYRKMRQRYAILMEAGEPYGGTWNLDSENRRSWTGTPAPPGDFPISNDLSAVVADIRKAGVTTMGTINEQHVAWPVTREQALDVLSWFIDECLPHFGPYQDAMTTSHATLFHSRLSFALNTKMLHPHEVIRRVEESFRSSEQQCLIRLSSVEGFIRQILGWREYVRCVYWASMPGYATLNVFNHNAPLPHWFWTGETKMACVRDAVTSSLNNAYAHHIQRLMITGNIALLLGCNPTEVDAWYLGVYIDAFEWVEMPNTRGMSQFADGGQMASKPYVSSASYINRMSDYCSQCSYNPKLRTGEGSCPFTSLYWDFFDRNRTVLAKNHRLGMVYRTLDTMNNDVRAQLLQQAQHYRSNADQL